MGEVTKVTIRRVDGNVIWQRTREQGGPARIRLVIDGEQVPVELNRDFEVQPGGVLLIEVR